MDWERGELGPVSFRLFTNLDIIHQNIPDVSMSHVHPHHCLHTTLQPLPPRIVRHTPEERERERERVWGGGGGGRKGK